MEDAFDDANINLLFVGNKEKVLHSTFNFLEKRGWKCRFVLTMKDAFAEAARERPTHVFISWTLTSTNVTKAVRAFMYGFKLPCIVYTEFELDTKKQHALSGSGIKNYIMSPVSGTGVFVKLKSMMSKTKQAAVPVEKDETSPTKGENKPTEKKNERIVVKSNPMPEEKKSSEMMS